MRLSILEYILAGVAAVLLVVCLWLGVTRSMDRNKLDAAQARYQNAVGANATNVLTIADLKAANADWAVRCVPDVKATADALQRSAAEITRLSRELEQARANREVIYVKDPAAAAWGTTGVPSRIADQLFPRPAR